MYSLQVYIKYYVQIAQSMIWLWRIINSFASKGGNGQIDCGFNCFVPQADRYCTSFCIDDDFRRILVLQYLKSYYYSRIQSIGINFFDIFYVMFWLCQCFCVG